MCPSTMSGTQCLSYDYHGRYLVLSYCPYWESSYAYCLAQWHLVHRLPPAWYWQDTNGISLKLPTVPGKDQPNPCNITLHLEIQCPVIHTTQWQHQPRPTNAALTHCERTLTPNQPITHWTTRSILSGV
jgi:hypothetical protein